MAGIRRHLSPIRQTAEAAIIETLGNLGDFVGGIGVVITLVYLALQIRQNTRASRAATFLGLTNAWQDYLLASVDADLVDLRIRATADPDSLSEADYIRFFSLARVLFRRFENDFFQYRSGTFDSGGWEGYRRSLTTEIIASPTIRAFWEQQRSVFAPEFTAYVDAQLDSARQVEEDTARSLHAWKEIARRESAV